MERDYTLVGTHELRTNDLVRINGAVLRVYAHRLEGDRHVFKTEVADASEWRGAKKDLKDYEVSGTHLDLWARIRR